MMSSAALEPNPAPLIACTISRDVQNFDLLIEDMEQKLGENWGDLSFDDALIFLQQPDARDLKFVAIAMNGDDEDALPDLLAIVQAAKAINLKVIVIAEEVSPIILHQLLRGGADDFVPYPLPENALHEAVERLEKKAEAAPELVYDNVTVSTLTATNDRDGVILPVHGLAGGVGASNFAVNLAWELSDGGKKKGADAPRVCLIDLDLQFGSVATYLDLPRREAVYEILSDTAGMDNDAFMQALLTFHDRLHVFTAPSEILPLDIVDSADITAILDKARANFDYVVVDMPSTLVSWTETVLQASHIYFAMLELDMRSAQNVVRMVRALKAEDLPHEKLRFVLNRAPRFTDLSGKARVKRLSESLDIKVELLLPDGAKQVTQACDHGLPLAETAAKNPLRKEIQKVAKSLHDLVMKEATG
ncbi:pilus assembly protein CpaE [Pacificitalea manganoxidans]|uniref:Pilus assembly protein CpaE n=1 Tax=Pacificitalea manganoxidans TaxID=1411902 RepID=A0A291LY97_9RHOB|nr:AAA family ATPase [Pacificitalea manganoxidans]MAQ44517.1 pilus assembly protein CpaE [Actibacterium sp.]OWU71267.1 pilus assembly protein CpaE [Roseovarius sp. 22II1-1F6A]ATI41488.1 pilus assembly protein CpaE [Pacificitalea manganoxidans]MBF54089.1 pilus assembly protein CpaE [Actibacterium sp.]MDR6308907.1 pilus assembly protein CpaE [Pacificitalea manganoxidans]|tara:strand:- start:114 stop:1370 length:1257 start_codon:yes stop_codon:yes gene_type:complete